MGSPPRAPTWIGTAMLVGALYLIISLASAALAKAAPSGPMRFGWRLSAYVVAAVVFVAQLAHERLRLRNPVRASAWHAAAAAAFGGFAVAASANLHDLALASGHRPRMLIALVAWPLLAAVPAFVVGLVVAAGLRPAHPRPSIPAEEPDAVPSRAPGGRPVRS